jgi:hypothetical protein
MMRLHAIYAGLGEDRLGNLLRQVSLGKLKTYQLFERLKARAHLSKLNQDTLRRAAPRLWSRLQEGDEELATDLAQCILVSHLDMIVALLDYLGVPHNDGFFEKDAGITGRLAGGWQNRAYEAFRGNYSEELLVFYLNHLAREVDENSALFLPAVTAP